MRWRIGAANGDARDRPGFFVGENRTGARFSIRLISKIVDREALALEGRCVIPTDLRATRSGEHVPKKCGGIESRGGSA
jgi:hypothetical protein